MTILYTQLVTFFIATVCFATTAQAQTTESKRDQLLQKSGIIRFEYDGLQPKPEGVYALLENLGEGWQVVQMSELPDLRRQTPSQEVLYVKSDLTHVQPLFEKVERVRGQVFDCNFFGSDSKAYTPCTSRLTKASLGTVGKALLGVMSLGAEAGTMRMIDGDLMTDLIRQSDLLTKVEIAKRQFDRDRGLKIYQQDYAKLRSIAQHNAFIAKFANDDFGGKLPEVVENRNALVAKENAEREYIARYLLEQKKRTEAKLAVYRSGIKLESQTNCGPVLEMKLSLLKVYFPVANYGAEHWIRKDQIFPPDFRCEFNNGIYIPPVP